MKKSNIIFIMFIFLEINLLSNTAAAKDPAEGEQNENDDIFPRRLKPTPDDDDKKYRKLQENKKIHFIKIIGDHPGSNGKFVTFRRDDETILLRNKNDDDNNNQPIPVIRDNQTSTTDIKDASELNITTDVNNTWRDVNKKISTGDVNNNDTDRNDVNKEGIYVNNGDKMQYLLKTSTTDVTVDSSDFKAKDNAGTTQKNSTKFSVPGNNEKVVGETDDLNQLSFINDKLNKNNNDTKPINDTKSDVTKNNEQTLSDQMRLKEQTDLLVKVTDYGLKEMHELFDVKERKIYESGVYLQNGSPGRYLAAFNSQTDELKKLARFGYASLKASAKLKEELSSSTSRLQLLNITEENTKKFPQISLLDTSLHDDCPLRHQPRCPNWGRLYRTVDGTCNNFNQAWWGSVFQPLKRFLPPAYDDDLEAIRRSIRGGPLPSPRIISTVVHWDRDITSSSVTHMVMQWGQFIDHDMTSSSQSRGFNGSVPRCCETSPEFQHPDCLPIEVPPNDRFYSQFRIRCLEFIRSAPTSRVGCSLGPREQVNQVTSYIDGSMIYGNTQREASHLRLFRNGMLRYTRMQQRQPLLPSDRNRGEFCREPNTNFDCFLAGDGRINENPGLIAIHVLFLRLHNRLARQLSHLNPQWSDERLYQETRKIVGAVIQHVTYGEFLPVVLGPDVLEIFDLNLLKEGYYPTYSEKVNAQAANAFATAAFRFGHSLVQGRFLKWDGIRQQGFTNVTLHEELNDPATLHRFGAVDGFLLGMCMQESQRRDEHLTEELTNHLFETPRFPAGLDLASINIQRGRDHGLPSYNSWRNPCGLRKMETWEDLLNVMHEETRNNLQRAYRDVDDIDLYTGGLSEFPVRGGIVGSTFSCIIAQHFRNLRRGDRFWYENGGFESSFTPNQLQAIRKITFARILCDNLDISDSIQPFVFLTVDKIKNAKVPCRSKTIPFIDLTPWEESGKGKWNQKPTASKTEKIPVMPHVTPDPFSSDELPRPIFDEDDA